MFTPDDIFSQLFLIYAMIHKNDLDRVEIGIDSPELVLRREILNAKFKRAKKLSFIALLAQFMGLISVCHAISDDRKLAVCSWKDFLTRMIFCAVIK